MQVKRALQAVSCAQGCFLPQLRPGKVSCSKGGNSMLFPPVPYSREGKGFPCPVQLMAAWWISSFCQGQHWFRSRGREHLRIEALDRHFSHRSASLSLRSTTQRPAHTLREPSFWKTFEKLPRNPPFGKCSETSPLAPGPSPSTTRLSKPSPLAPHPPPTPHPFPMTHHSSSLTPYPSPRSL